MDNMKSKTRKKWTYSDKIRLAKMWRNGESKEQIASIFKVSQSAINTQIVRMRASGWDVPKKIGKNLNPPPVIVDSASYKLKIAILILIAMAMVVIIAVQAFK